MTWAHHLGAWPHLFQNNLTASGHPVEMVSLGMYGSTTADEAATYPMAAPRYNNSVFSGYSNGREPSLILIWGGANNSGGGQLASASPVAYANLSAFQRGVYDQINEVTTAHPRAKIVLLEYGGYSPSWLPAYNQVLGLFSSAIQSRISYHAVNNSVGDYGSCYHPSPDKLVSWAAELSSWLLSQGLVP